MVTRKPLNITLAALLLNWLRRGRFSVCLCWLSDLLFVIMIPLYRLRYILLLLILCLTITLIFWSSAVSLAQCDTAEVQSTKYKVQSTQRTAVGFVACREPRTVIMLFQ